MRIIIIGFGAIGGVIGAHLHRAGAQVVAVARGAQYEAVKATGLQVDLPHESFTALVPVVSQIKDIEPADGDVVLLAVKTQHTIDVLDELAAAGLGELPIVCAQNGLESERIVLRRFRNVYAMCVNLPATYVKPGLVECNATPRPGILDLGRYPSGIDAVAEAVAASLTKAGFKSEAQPDMQRWKYGKLLLNLGNAMEVCCGPGDWDRDLYFALRTEAEAILTEAGLPFTSFKEDQAHRAKVYQIKPVEGRERGGSSSWQSIARETGNLEIDYLTGEIVLLARLLGMDAPLNARVAAACRSIASGLIEPGTLDPKSFLEDQTNSSAP